MYEQALLRKKCQTTLRHNRALSPTLTANLSTSYSLKNIFAQKEEEEATHTSTSPSSMYILPPPAIRKIGFSSYFLNCQPIVQFILVGFTYKA